MNVYKKLIDARVKLLGTELKKTGHNKFAGYHYFELGDFLPATQKIFQEVGLVGVVNFGSEFAELKIYDTEGDGVITIKSPMASAALKGAHDIQNLGAVQTYLRRYLWVAAMEITDGDPIDSSEPRVEKKAEKVDMSTGEIKTAPTTSGGAGPWSIKISAKEGSSIEDWAQVAKDATFIALDSAQKVDDVMSIFKVNRQLFDRLKADAEQIHTEIMVKFKEKKEQLNG